MGNLIHVRINSRSRIPKYQQIINSIVEDVEKGNLKVGDKIPSINDLSAEHYLSRDTVEKAYNHLKERKIILSVKGKGYYVSKTLLNSKTKVLFLLNKLSSYKLRIYNAFVDSMGSGTQVDLHVYHYDPAILINLLEENIGAYDYYVLLPHFKNKKLTHRNAMPEIVEMLKKIPEDKLVIMDNCLPEMNGSVASIYQDFKNDIYEALKEGNHRLEHYEKLILVYPRKVLYPHPEEILEGFQNFCIDFGFDYEVLDTIYPEMELQSRDAFITIEEMDLVNLVKQIRDQGLTLGKEIGVISYNDTPLKSLLDITVVSTDFKAMGETAAYMIRKRKKEMVKNVFRFIDRGSL